MYSIAIIQNFHYLTSQTGRVVTGVSIHRNKNRAVTCLLDHVVGYIEHKVFLQVVIAYSYSIRRANPEGCGWTSQIAACLVVSHPDINLRTRIALTKTLLHRPNRYGDAATLRDAAIGPRRNARAEASGPSVVSNITPPICMVILDDEASIAGGSQPVGGRVCQHPDSSKDTRGAIGTAAHSPNACIPDRDQCHWIGASEHQCWRCAEASENVLSWCCVDYVVAAHLVSLDLYWQGIATRQIPGNTDPPDYIATSTEIWPSYAAIARARRGDGDDRHIVL